MYSKRRKWTYILSFYIIHPEVINWFYALANQLSKTLHIIIVSILLG